jgi:putative lipoprotein
VLLVALGCAPAGDSARPLGPVALEGTEWALVSLHGRPPLAGSRITLEVEGRTVGGYSGCNWYGGTYRSEEGELEVDEIQSTARACEVPDLMEQESRYHAALASVRSYTRREGRLELADASRRATLVFAQRETLAMDPQMLIGTSWRLRSGGTDPGEPGDTTITLAFERGVASGFAGCRDYTATYEAMGDRIYFTSFSMASTECDREEAALLREGRFTTDLGESTYWSLFDGRLELVTYGGRTLTFSADPGR